MAQGLKQVIQDTVTRAAGNPLLCAGFPAAVFRAGRLVAIALLVALFLGGCTEDYTFGAKAAVENDTTGGTTSDTVSTPATGESTVRREARVTAESCTSLIEGVPRGVSCMHCMEPAAREQRELLLQVLEQSCLQNVALSVLVDNSFSWDEAFLIEAVDRLTAGGRRLFLHFYLLNGPSQRRYETTVVPGIFTSVSPEQFRRNLVSDPETRSLVRRVTQRAIPAMIYALNSGAVVQLVPMLEDNLNSSSFEQLSNIILEKLPAGLEVALGRNPCPRCYRGNDGFVPAGFFEENHPELPSLSSTAFDGVICNDGVDVGFDGEASGKILSLEQLAAMRDRAAQENNIFLFWNAEYQGLSSSPAGITGADIPPARRPYGVPTPAEMEAMVAFLRGE